MKNISNFIISNNKIFFKKTSLLNSFNSLGLANNKSIFHFSKFNFINNNNNNNINNNNNSDGNVDSMIDNILKNKGSDRGVNRDERYNNRNNSRFQNFRRESDFQSDNIGQGFNNQNENLNQRHRRTKVILVRDGMILTANMTKNFINMQNVRKDGYVHIEIKETNSNPDDVTKDDRFYVLNYMALCKMLLIEPKLKADPNNLQSLKISQKFREFEIIQKEDNKYSIKIAATTRDQIQEYRSKESDNNATIDKPLRSQIDISAEDMKFLLLYVESCVKQLAGF